MQKFDIEAFVKKNVEALDAKTQKKAKTEKQVLVSSVDAHASTTRSGLQQVREQPTWRDWWFNT